MRHVQEEKKPLIRKVEYLKNGSPIINSNCFKTVGVCFGNEPEYLKEGPA